MKLKSGVYFVHYDDIPAFVKTARAQGRYFCGETAEAEGRRFAENFEKITREIYKNTYRPFSIDKDSVRFSYWSPCSLEAMKSWRNWGYTDHYIELWKPNQKKVIL